MQQKVNIVSIYTASTLAGRAHNIVVSYGLERENKLFMIWNFFYLFSKFHLYYFFKYISLNKNVLGLKFTQTHIILCLFLLIKNK